MNTTMSSCAACGSTARSTCKACSLVLYCGAECQKAHWAQHKVHCKSFLGKPSWQPQWLLQNRAPAFMDGPVLHPFGAAGAKKKYLWGNVPAYDALQLSSNEGADYNKDLQILFAASGDIRNVVKTIACLPTGFTQRIEMYINDIDLDVVARNLILLLVALSVEDDKEAVECMIHVWCSAFLRECDMTILRDRIRPMIEDVCRKIQDKPSATFLGKTWSFAQHSCRIELTKESWGKLLLYLDNIQSLTTEQAHKIRSAVTLAPERVDYRDRHMLVLTPTQRICKQRFREDGLLLPFGASRLGFDVPNPTIFHGDTWPMKDDADPLLGWSLPEILKQNVGPTSNDIYGKLYCHLYDQLSLFRRSLHAGSGCDFKLFNMDAAALARQIDDATAFDRIETSNIADGAYLGTQRTLACLGTRLRTPEANPHATLITAYMNAVEEAVQSLPPNSAIQLAECRRIEPYVFVGGKRPKLGHPLGKESILLAASQDLGRDVNMYFDRYMHQENFAGMQPRFGLKVKAEHTVIEKWPTALKLKLPQPGAQEEFDVLLALGHGGNERYVEWKWV